MCRPALTLQTEFPLQSNISPFNTKIGLSNQALLLLHPSFSYLSVAAPPSSSTAIAMVSWGTWFLDLLCPGTN